MRPYKYMHTHHCKVHNQLSFKIIIAPQSAIINYETLKAKQSASITMCAFHASNQINSNCLLSLAIMQ